LRSADNGFFGGLYFNFRRVAGSDAITNHAAPVAMLAGRNRKRESCSSRLRNVTTPQTSIQVSTLIVNVSAAGCSSVGFGRLRTRYTMHPRQQAH
jgi:hypothetical protein